MIRELAYCPLILWPLEKNQLPINHPQCNLGTVTADMFEPFRIYTNIQMSYMTLLTENAIDIKLFLYVCIKIVSECLHLQIVFNITSVTPYVPTYYDAYKLYLLYCYLFSTYMFSDWQLDSIT